jgi:membrane protein
MHPLIPFFSRILTTLKIWIAAAYRSIQAEGLDYRATSLAYTTLLTIVPGLALVFSLLKTFGVNRHLEPFLLQLLEPLGDKAATLTDKTLDFVGRINVGVLGFVGLFTLIYVSVSMLSKIESAFNHIWRVTESRSLMRRAGDYISVIMLGPLLMFSAMGLTASLPGAQTLQKLGTHEPFATLFFLGGKLLSLLLVVAAFGFVYLYIPNTRVPWRAALFGGVVGGLTWKLGGLLFAHFVATSASYHAIYSGLAIVILFLVWLDLSWLILLLGGQAAMYFQHPYFIKGHKCFQELGSRLREGLGLSLMTLIAQRFINNQPPWSIDALAEHAGLPWVTVQEALAVLSQGGLIEETHRDDGSFLPARDIAGITVTKVLKVMRAGSQEQGQSYVEERCLLPAVAEVMAELEREALDSPSANLSLRELALNSDSLQYGSQGLPS